VFVTLIDGFLLHQVARPGNPGADAESLFETMRALFIAHAMDETQFEQWRKRIHRVSPRSARP